MEVDRSLEPITEDDLKDLYVGSVKRLQEYFIHGEGAKWQKFYNIEKPLVAALCQGAAMHYYDKITGVKDFDVWFFILLIKNISPIGLFGTGTIRTQNFPGIHQSLASRGEGWMF